MSDPLFDATVQDADNSATTAQSTTTQKVTTT